VTSRSLALTIALASCSQARPETAAPPPPAPAPAPTLRGVDVTVMDRSVAPGEDFYGFANGAYLRTAEIPADRSSTGSFVQVIDLVEGRNHTLADELATGTAPAGSPERKAGDLYATFLDEARIDALGLRPLEPTLERIRKLRDARALAGELGSLVRADVDIFNCTSFETDRPLGLFVEQDLSEPARNTAYLLQGGLGLPDRSYYLDESPKLADIRAKYVTHLETLLRLAGVADGAAKAKRVMALETALARTHATREASADVQKGNNPWKRADFDKRAPGLDWAAFLTAAGLDKQPHFIIWHPTAVTGLAALVKSQPLSTWKEYLTVRALDRAARFLPKAFADESFAFYGTTLNGTPAQQARWKRALAIVDASIGEALGRAYVQRYFPPEAKAEIKGMVANIKQAFARRIEALAWMAPETKKRAQEKLAALEVGIGYPDAWRDYSGLEIVRGELLADVERGSLFEYRRNLAKLAAKPDRAEWCMLPHTVNAVNLPVRNALNFPAGIMEAPFYDAGATPAVKYAAIGAVIGHEISHSFDDQGAQFDASGRLTAWWTPADLASFQAAGKKLVAQYDGYRPFPDLAVNGTLTLSENIADLAGLAAAYDAWRASSSDAPTVDGFTGEQQFFVAFAQTWQSKMREPAYRRRLLTDGHAPGPFRALTVRNVDAWYAAFPVKEGEALYLAPEARVRVW